jgi:ubiquinone/menaquinone biosynthesis C-methylase UbiE
MTGRPATRPGPVGVAAVMVTLAAVIWLLVWISSRSLFPAASQAAPAALGPQTKAGNRLFPAADLGLIEPPDRNQWQPPELIMDDLGIADGAVVADLGAGGGWFAIQLARRVGPGIVYAVDVQPQMIEAVRRRAQREGVFNIRTVLGTSDDPKLPPGIDVAMIVDTYREMACAQRPSCIEPVTLLKNVARTLRPQGRLGVIDFFPGGGGPGPAPEERVAPETVIKAAADARLQLISEKAVPPFQFQYLLVFAKAADGRGAR